MRGTGLVRREVRVSSVAGLLRAKTRGAGLFRRLSVLATGLLLTVASAQSNAVDQAITDFQTEGLRLIGLISAVGIAVIAAGVLMTLGWAMLRKVGGGK